jgi:hypothetical protein
MNFGKWRASKTARSKQRRSGSTMKLGRFVSAVCRAMLSQALAILQTEIAISWIDQFTCLNSMLFGRRTVCAFVSRCDESNAFVAEDDHIKGRGAVGVWTKADSVTFFDDFSYGTRYRAAPFLKTSHDIFVDR